MNKSDFFDLTISANITLFLTPFITRIIAGRLKWLPCQQSAPSRTHDKGDIQAGFCMISIPVRPSGYRGHGSAVSLRQINCRDTALPCPCG